MKILLITTLVFFSLTRASSQTKNSGQLIIGKIESADRQVMFTTIGIMGGNVGTISNQRGYFELEIPDELTKQMLTISHIGYETLSLNIDSLLALDSVIIQLNGKVEYLDEVIVTSKKLKGKTKEYGNTRKHDLFLWIQNGDKGSEIATLITPKIEIYLNSVSVNVLNNSQKEFTLLLNLYTVDKMSGLPGKQLLRNQIIINSNKKKGWLDVDLREENLILNESLFVGIQWTNVDEPIPLIGGKSSNSKKSLIRYRALGTWEKFAEWDIKIRGTSFKAP